MRSIRISGLKFGKFSKYFKYKSESVIKIEKLIPRVVILDNQVCVFWQDVRNPESRSLSTRFRGKL